MTTGLMLLVGCGGISESDIEATVEARVVETITAEANKKTYINVSLDWTDQCEDHEWLSKVTGRLTNVSTGWESGGISLNDTYGYDSLKVEVPDGGAYRGKFNSEMKPRKTDWQTFRYIVTWWDRSTNVNAGETLVWPLKC